MDLAFIPQNYTPGSVENYLKQHLDHYVER